MNTTPTIIQATTLPTAIKEAIRQGYTCPPNRASRRIICGRPIWSLMFYGVRV